MALHNILGDQGEERAARYLKSIGYEVLQQNYDSRLGQIDIIAKDKETYIFVEVKTRESGGYGSPEEQFARNRTQQRRIVGSALMWLKRRGGHPAARFDLIVIDHSELRHHKNAFTDERRLY